MPTSSATDWLLDHPEDVDKLGDMMVGLDPNFPIHLWTEMPVYMKEEIALHLSDSFTQPYWDDISEATLGNAEVFLREGLDQGWSVQRIAREMAHSFQGDTHKYALMRATRIARTETGGALNGARRATMDRLIDDMPEELPIKHSWRSVLGPTTRDSHASLDGVPAGKDGMWQLGGVRVPWPRHFSLPAGERINCQCDLSLDFGLQDEEAAGLIQDYHDREESNLY